MAHFDNFLGIHEQALNVRVRRSELLSANIANSDTPNYKARDIDFRQVLMRAASDMQGASQIRTTHSRHMMPQGAEVGGEPLYRTPLQDSIDGNTVDTHMEKSAYLENALRYQATLTFINGRIGSLRKAFKGE